MLTDAELLRSYFETNDENAFAELVRRHAGFVHAAARRRIGDDEHLAKDITQQVFVALARGAGKLRWHPRLVGWLHVATRHAAAQVARAERRRRKREERAGDTMSPPETPGEVDSAAIRPVLDRAIDDLPAGERAVVLLRFFEDRPFAEIGCLLRVSEDAARMRVGRALERLRAGLARRGVVSSAAALELVMEAEAHSAVPPALVGAIHASVVGAAGASSGVTAGILGFMSATKVTVTIAAVVALLAAGTAWQMWQAKETSAAENSALQAKLTAALEKLSGLSTDLARTRSELQAVGRAKAALENRRKPASEDYLTDLESRRRYLSKMAARLEVEVRPFFLRHGLTGEQWQKYKSVVVREQNAELDARAAALRDHLTRAQEEMLLAPAADAGRAEIEAVLGPDMRRQLVSYNLQQSTRNFAAGLAGDATYAGAPWTSEQADKVVDILSSDRTGFRRSSDGAFTISDEMMARIKGVLSPAQFDLLEQQAAAHRP